MLPSPDPPLSASPSPPQVLRMMIGIQVTDEQLECITDRTIQEADKDGDKAISFEEFAKVPSIWGWESYLWLGGAVKG